MANGEHLERLSSGAKKWNEWRSGPTQPLVENGVTVDLSGTNLMGLNLSEYDLSHCNLSRCVFGQLNGNAATLRNTNFNNSNLQRAEFDGADLTDTTFIGADLTGGSFKKVAADDADFTNSILIDAELSQSQFRRVDFYGARLSAASFSGSHLINCDFRYSNLTRANFHSCAKIGNRFSHTINMKSASGLSKLDISYWDKKSGISDFNPPRHMPAIDIERNNIHIGKASRENKIAIKFTPELVTGMLTFQHILEGFVAEEDWTPECNRVPLNVTSKEFNALCKLVEGVNSWIGEEGYENIVMAFLDRVHDKIKGIRPFTKKLGDIVGETVAAGKDIAGLDKAMNSTLIMIEKITKAIRSDKPDQED